jgi:predicted nucleic acid-binding protein
MVVIDASVWISHLIPHEIHHGASRRWLMGIINDGGAIAVPALLLAEVGGAIARRTGDPDLGYEAVAHIIATPNLRLVYTDEELGLLAAHLAAAQRLRGADATYVAVAQRLDIPFASWDQELLNRAAAVVTVQTPAPEGG